ncbi:MAG: AAA family ATPase [Bacteroidales bacterium]|jgi:ATP-dependent exoDNAse (exonuclease V) alpha subunit|nr:AAA family ATPase [Bacteroidales bacterium]
MEDCNRYFSFPLSGKQKEVFDALCDFYTNKEGKIFILRGYAGTGKTSLIGGFIKKLCEEIKQNSLSDMHNGGKNIIPFKVLASTGRAAKILSDKTSVNAKTIHSLIYGFVGLSDDVDKILEEERKRPEIRMDQYGQLRLVFEPQKRTSQKNTYYIVDESSMVSDKKKPSMSNAIFGEGDLLGDFFNFDTEGKFIFVGDPCQLPPIHQKESPALHADYLRNKYKMKVQEYSLTEIFRQDEKNDILRCAFALRELWQFSINQDNSKSIFTPLPLKGYQNIKICLSELNLLQEYINIVKTKGYDYTTLICNSNKECNYLSLYVREAIHGKRELIIIGDLLLVTQNNYIVDLVNGDLVVVKWIGEREYRAGLRFVKVEVEELASKKLYRLLLIEDLLMNGQANLDERQHKNLIIDFAKRMEEKKIKTKTKEFYGMMLKDPYLNALRTTYGYALTCHKSQGGEWSEVFLYLQKSLCFRRGSELYQWAYTAVTRSKKTLHIIDNWLIK